MSGAFEHGVPERVKAVITEVARSHGLRPADILGRERSARYVEPRQEAFFKARAISRADGAPVFSLSQLGRHFHRDHSTVLHGIRKHLGRAGEGPDA